jgi:glycosyltransferase involved in cell wall biosynthesis
VVLSEHLSDIARGTLSSREVRAAQRAYRAVAVICPVSDDLGRRVKQLADGTELITVPNPVDTELFRPNPSKDELGSRGPAEARLLTVGNLVEVKGHRYLIEACRGLRGDGLSFHLDIVGDGPLRAELEGEVRSAGLGDVVTFHGVMSRADVAHMMRAADVFVLPSLWETMGCVLIEAMASGTPCVATDVGATGEIVDSKTGILVEPASGLELGRGLTQLLERRRSFDASTLHDRAVRRYGYDVSAERVTRVYEMVRERRLLQNGESYGRD